ncbi:hypothetical protein NLI96_g10416 [Meripilus lineatus]|uniref:NAD(P)-binding protein n=1 Tax=Meripilus lineatus TaxID=2056292 RepID=A0AAD5UTN6_9APHY|nr:hypothetical protein NLI96_g10416 [Physisporinus lineatus]
MVRVRSEVEAAWRGLDTILVCAGVSALRPLMEVAGVHNHKGHADFSQASVDSIRETVRIADAAQKGNYMGPLVSAVTFIPLLEFTSRSPSVLLVSSLAAIVGAPTRSLYCSTKAASLLLYQSLAIEHPSIRFSFIIPSTVEGDFRASAVDGGTVREANPNKHGLKREAVAKRCIRAVDSGEKIVMMPVLFSRAGHFLYWIFPSLIERVAAKKYNYAAQ